MAAATATVMTEVVADSLCMMVNPVAKKEDEMVKAEKDLLLVVEEAEKMVVAEKEVEAAVDRREKAQVLEEEDPTERKVKMFDLHLREIMEGQRLKIIIGAR